MANTLTLKKSQIYSEVKAAAAKVYKDIEIPEFTIETPRDKGHGDYAVNIAMLLARSAKEAPRLIAEKIINEINKESLGAEKVELAGPGFINFYLDKSYLLFYTVPNRALFAEYASFTERTYIKP